MKRDNLSATKECCGVKMNRIQHGWIEYWIGLDSSSIYSKSNNGSPTSEISWTVDFKSKIFAKTILKIFCTLIECEADEKINGAFIALAYFRANLSTSSISSCGNVEYVSYFVPIRNAWADYEQKWMSE